MYIRLITQLSLFLYFEHTDEFWLSLVRYKLQNGIQSVLAYFVFYVFFKNINTEVHKYTNFP